MKGAIGKFLLAKQCGVCLDTLPFQVLGTRSNTASLFLGVVTKGGSGNWWGGFYLCSENYV